MCMVCLASAAGCLTARAQPSPDAPPADAAKPPDGAGAVDTELPRQPPENPRPPTGIEEELLEIRPGIALKRRFDAFAEKTNLRIGMAYSMLFQQASGGPGDRNAGGGDFDLLAKWTAIGAGTKDTGIVAFAGEYRHQIGDQPPSELSGDIGSLLPTTNGFSERPPVVKELYWDQRLLEDRLRYVIGRVDPENLFGGHRMQSANTFFLNKAFSTNPTVAYPGAGLTIAALAKPTTWSYIEAGLCNANGKTTTMGIESFFDEKEFLTFAEFGVTPNIEGVGAGRYRVSVWHVDEREDAGKPSDAGFTVSVDQDLGDTWTAFARYGHADGDVTGISDSVQGGVGIKNVLGKDNLLGLAAGWSRPTDDTLRDEKVAEVFQRFQITETFQFTLDAELIIDPSNAPDDDLVGVFSARLRCSF